MAREGDRKSSRVSVTLLLVSEIIFFSSPRSSSPSSPAWRQNCGRMEAVFSGRPFGREPKAMFRSYWRVGIIAPAGSLSLSSQWFICRCVNRTRSFVRRSSYPNSTIRRRERGPVPLKLPRRGCPVAQHSCTRFLSRHDKKAEMRHRFASSFFDNDAFNACFFFFYIVFF